MNDVCRVASRVQLKAPGRKVLIADPEITTFRPCGLIDEFVVIATDGLWDVMSSQGAWTPQLIAGLHALYSPLTPCAPLQMW